MKSSYDRIVDVFDKLKDKKLKEVGRINENVFTRNRTMPFEDLSLCILSKKGLTLSMELEQFFDKKNNFDNTVSKQAFSKQRMNLNPELFKVMNQNYVTDIYNETKVETFHNYILLGIDGSVIEIPNTNNLKEIYGGITDNKKNVIVARAQTSGIYDCINHIMIDSIISPYKTSEISLAKENIKNALNQLKDRKILLIFDRGYPSIEFIHYLNKLDVKYLFRIQNKAYMTEKNSMKTNDEIVDLKISSGRLQHINDKNIKEELKKNKYIKNIRITKIRLDNGEQEELISNLDINEINYNEMKMLYYKRWNIELSYDILKNKLYVENFSGKTPITIEQDFYSQILLYNMLEDLKKDASIHLKTNNNLKYKYKINMNCLIGLFRNKMIEIATEKNDNIRKNLYLTLINKIQRYLVPIKPNRTFNRKRVFTDNKYTTNLRRNS